ncbi:MAG TPA: hypothetical protein VEH07_00040, partial [Alphaproteobacteria bacterium]|nr:hypothetical protein [Alphaproteobacteria bacterium]
MSETPTNATPDQPTPAQAAAPTKVEQRAGLWSRIKEHKILQWALGYAGAALALAHGQELLADTYEWPHLIGQVFMAMLILGLPIVLTLAWYHGHKGLKRISAAEAAIIALLLVIVGGGFFLFVHGSRESESREAKAEPAKAAAQRAVDQATTGLAPTSVTAAEGVTLAVLPFVNMSDDKEQEYFSDGLSEELINQLAQIEGLRVTGRTSSFYFKGKSEDLRVIGEKLGVANILEGSVRKAGD